MNTELEHELEKLRAHNQALTNAFDRSERAVAEARQEAQRLRACMEEAITQLTGEPDSIGWIAVELWQGLVFGMDETQAQLLWRTLTGQYAR